VQAVMVLTVTPSRLAGRDSYQERLQGLLTGPTNHHNPFRCDSSFFIRYPGSFPRCHSS